MKLVSHKGHVPCPHCSRIVRHIPNLHARIGWLANLALQVPGAEKIALELAELRGELSAFFEKVRPPRP